MFSVVAGTDAEESGKNSNPNVSIESVDPVGRTLYSTFMKLSLGRYPANNTFIAPEGFERFAARVI